MTRTVCVTCEAPYAPALVDWACPVCDTPTPDAPRRRVLPEDDTLTAIVLTGTVLNVVLLAVLAAIVLSR